ncbi:uncharacterized protein LOC125229038 [Leguminivora glycinivorella]|uniref:uncharacterized protein LOC125229038 n=1 Tax=Leguminivora glycinivorella TaxID=1035111 RepID=UPI00200EAA51|nr:uncharacterized protein LOC125229038 [Leguminivora glycinivorella]
MMKITLCSLVVLSVVAQICAIPAGADPEKEIKGAVNQVAGAAEGVKNDATKEAENAVKQGQDQRNPTPNADGAKHGPGCHKHGAGKERPLPNIMKVPEKIAERVADTAVKVLRDIFGFFNV